MKRKSCNFVDKVGWAVSTEKTLGRIEKGINAFSNQCGFFKDKRRYSTLKVQCNIRKMSYGGHHLGWTGSASHQTRVRYRPEKYLIEHTEGVCPSVVSTGIIWWPPYLIFLILRFTFYCTIAPLTPEEATQVAKRVDSYFNHSSILWILPIELDPRNY